MECRLEDVTPELAALWLKKMARNRSVAQSKVDKFASDMKGGFWALTHQGIAFDENGRLIDGQNRLRAIIRADVTVPMYVFRECSKKSMPHIDQGSIRTAGNQIQILGIVKTNNYNTVAGVARSMIAGLRLPFGVISTGAILRCVTKHRDDLMWVLGETGSRMRFATAYAPVVKAVIEHGRGPLVDFCNSLRDNTFEGRGAFANVLSRWLFQPRKSTIRFSHNEIYGRSVSAVRAYLQKRPLKSLSASPLDICLPDFHREFLTKLDAQDGEEAKEVQPKQVNKRKR